MSAPQMWRVLAWAATIAGLTWLFVLAQGVDHRVHQQVLGELAEVDRLHSEIDQDVLKLRYQVALNFDALNAHQTRLVRSAERVTLLLRQVESASDTLKLAQDMNAWVRSHGRRVERFKSSNAILINALAYLPRQVAHLEQVHVAAAKAIDTSGLLRATLIFNLNSGIGTRAEMDAAGTRLTQVMRNSAGNTRADIEELATRFLTILAQREETNRLVRELTSEVQPPARALTQIYLAEVEQRANRAQIYRILLFVAALILLLYAASVFTRLRERGAQLRHALDDLRNQQFALDQHAIVSSADMDGNILYANERFCQVSGYAFEELHGKNHRLLNSGEHPPELFQGMWETISSGRVWHGQIKNRTKSGGHYWVNATIVPFLDGDGKPYQYISIRTDITEQKRQAEDLAIARDAAEAASRAKSQFLAAMSHEIRTPMNGIIGMTDLVLDMRLDNEQREYLTVVKHSAEHLLAILNDILDFSKIEAGRLELEVAPLALRGLLDGALKPLAVGARAKGVELDWSVAAHLANAWRGDPVRIRQVLLNLVGNALKFTEVGRVRVEVGADADAPGHLHIVVSDTGIGISAEQQARLFAPFTQADASTTRKYGGTGLGLVISRQLIELMGGRLWVESQPGQGSHFHCTLCLEPDRPGDELEGVGEGPEGGALARSLNILLAEDNAINRRLAVKLLERAGHRVQAVEDGHQALHAWREGGRYDLIILDMMMPELDGLATARAIREVEVLHGGCVPILAMTANAFEEDRRDCLAAGMDGFVTKPVRAAALHAEIARVTAR